MYRSAYASDNTVANPKHLINSSAYCAQHQLLLSRSERTNLVNRALGVRKEVLDKEQLIIIEELHKIESDKIDAEMA